MDAVPECPACKRILDADRVILQKDDGVQLFACSGCLALVGVRWESRETEREPVPISTIDTPGPVVARAIETLCGAEARGELVPAYLELRAGAPSILRIPEVFSVARPVIGRHAVMAEPGFFRVRRETAFEEGSVSGIWMPYESVLDLDRGHPDAIDRFLRREPTLAEPDMRFWPALLQLDEGSAMLTAGARLEILGDEPETRRLRVKPVRSAWARTNAIEYFRAPLDLLAPDPEAP